MMKESGSSNRGAGRAGAGGKNSVASSRSARQGRETTSSGRHSSFTLRRIVGWMPIIGKALFVICAAALLLAGYRAVASASFFRAGSVDIKGTERASADRIAAIVKRKAAAMNVWQLNLGEVSGEIEKEPWVRAAIVSRVLPGGLRVRITERAPVVVVRTSNGQLIWIDEDAVLLARVAPTDELPPFFLRGYDETLTAAAQAENRRRIAEAMKMTQEWRQAGVIDRVSEVNVEDLRDVRAQLAGRDAAVEVRLGASNHGARLEKALKVLDEERAAPGGRRGARIVRLDATIEKRITIGVGNGASMEPATPLDASDAGDDHSTPKDTSVTPSSAASVASTTGVKRTNDARVGNLIGASNTKPRDERKASPSVKERRDDERRLARENERKETKREAAKAKTTALAQRPRRVG